MLRIVLVLALVVIAATQQERPLVQTAYGTVRGTRNVEKGYSSFTGIRYAQAPTGRNRFGSASPPPTWSGIFEANQNNISCPQIQIDTFIGIQDCLTLNIYTPDVATYENPVAVIVYFYGGGFRTGTVIYYGEEFLIKHDIVVVFVNFRISALGHLCLRHELIPGNAAFKDQVAALRWIQQNIALFGGDPGNITIMGHSAGAVSVELLTLSPMAEGLFHRAIAISGSAEAYWAIDPEPRRSATLMAQIYLGYDGDSIEELVEFYLGLDDAALAQAVTQYYHDLQHRSLPVAACIEQTLPGIEAFLLDSPAHIVASGQFVPVPKIYALTNKEYLSQLLSSEVENTEKLIQEFETHLPTDLIFQSDQQKIEISNRLREFYIKDETSILESYINFMSDSMFYYSISRSAIEHATVSTKPTYMLEFIYESERKLTRLPEVNGIAGAGHGDDLLYVVMTTQVGQPISVEDQLIIDGYTKLLTNFAKYNNPTPDVNELQWPPLTATQFPYLQMGSEILILQTPNAEAMELWEQIYAQ